MNKLIKHGRYILLNKKSDKIFNSITIYIYINMGSYWFIFLHNNNILILKCNFINL
jgi:hypothetical protein